MDHIDLSLWSVGSFPCHRKDFLKTSVKQKLQGTSTTHFFGNNGCFVSALTKALIPRRIDLVFVMSAFRERCQFCLPFFSVPLPSLPAVEWTDQKILKLSLIFHTPLWKSRHRRLVASESCRAGKGCLSTRKLVYQASRGFRTGR